MKTQSIDSRSEVEKKLLALNRQASIKKKFAQVCSLSQTTSILAKRALRRANKGLSKRELDILFISNHYGAEIAANLKKYLHKLEHESS
jgi:hypothetical protein